MKTPVYTSKKLEKTIKPFIAKQSLDEEESVLGKWNATLFYVNRKKCWLVTNAKTRYNVLLTDLKAADIKNWNALFKDTLYSQLVYDGIIQSFETIDDCIGDTFFLPTDNDRPTTAFQNHRLEELEYWKERYESLEHMPVKKLNHNMNTSPFTFNQTMKRRQYTTAIDEMKALLAGYF